LGKPPYAACPGEEDRRVVTCRDVIMDLLFDYLEDSLSGELAAELEEHLKICPPCRAYIATYRKTRDLAAKETRPPMPEELKARLRALLLKKLSETTS
jgi:anti-sigma factor RsiW